MQKLFLYNNGPTGDLLFSRPLYKELIASRQFELVLGACRDDTYLLEDLAGDNTQLLASDYDNTWRGATLDLAFLKPSDALAVHTSFEDHPHPRRYRWVDAIEVFNLKMEEHGVDFAIEFDEHTDQIPMLGLPRPPQDSLPTIRRQSIYLDNTRTHDLNCYFVFDLQRLADNFPGFDFLCTSTPSTVRDNIVDCSHYNRIELAHLSDQCDALIGLTRDPFNCTLTEPNRFKPKVMCGYDARKCPTFWEYDCNPLEYLGTMDELVDFLLSTLWEKI